MSRTVLVTGASGFVGSHLSANLVEAGHDVRAMTRQPDNYSGAGVPVAGDVGDRDSLDKAMNGVQAAYYLVHSLGSADFEDKDADGARNFADAADAAGVERIVYLGGLGKDDGSLSPHLESRREVEHLLAGTAVPLTALRAAVVVGHGGISWEMTRQLIDHLPIMLTPKWVKTRTQPIALPDVIRYLAGVLEPSEALGRTYDVGGPEVLRYIDMLERAARVQGKSFRNVNVPMLSPRLSSRWLSLVTDVDLPTARALIDSMTNEVIVTERDIEKVVPGATISYDDAVRLALADRRRAESTSTDSVPS